MDWSEPGQAGEPLTKSVSADMEVLYWKHVKEQLETLRTLQRREASAHIAEVWDPRGPLVGEDKCPHRCSLW